MAARLQNTIYDANGQDWTIIIDDADYTGSAFDIDITAAKIQWQASSSERFAPVVPSVADIGFRVNGAIENAFVTDFIGAPEQRFRLSIYKGVNLFWVGNVQTDNVRKQDKEYPYIFSIRAADGLALLKDIDYNNDGVAYEGTATIAKHVCNALSKIGTSDLFSDLLAVNNNWYSDQHTTSSDVYNTSKIDYRRFIEIDSTGTKTYKSCYYVLESICKAFGSRIVLTDGLFRIVQINEYEGGDLSFLTYDSDGLPSSSYANTSYRLSDGTDILRLYGGSFQYYPALRSVQVNYKHYQAQSIIPADSVNSTLFSIDNVDSGGGTSTILFRTDYEAESSFTGDYVNDHRIKFGVQIKIGGKYLHRPASMSSLGVIYYGTAIWRDAISYVEYYTNALIEGAPIAFTATAILNSPAIPEDGQMDIVGQYLATVGPDGQNLTPGTFSSTISFYNSYLEIVPAGVLSSRANETIYTAENGATNNSKKITVNTDIGSGPTFNALGAIQVLQGVNYVNPAGWSVGATGTDTPIGQLLANEIISTQSKPIEIIASTYKGVISPLQVVYYDSIDYAVRQASIDLIDGNTQGLFFECNSTGAVLIEKDPEPIFEPEGEPISPFTPISEIIKNPNVEAQLDPTLQTFAQIQEIIVTDTAISAGDPITSIQISPSGSDDLIKTDDVITLIDQVTGQAQDFTVTADVLGTDTSIPVASDTADFDFSSGSSITFSQESLIIKINNVEVIAGVNSFTAGQGLVVDQSTGDITAQIDLSQITNIVTYDNTHYLVGTTAGGLMTKGNVLAMFANLLTAGSNVSLTNTGTQIEISSTASGGITGITTGAGLDNSGTSTVNITLDLNELSTLAFGLEYNDYLVGVSGVTNYKGTVLQTFDNLITAGTGISVTNTGTAIQIASTASSGVSSISVGTGLDGGGTGSVSITLDFSELPVLFYGLSGTNTIVGVSGSGTTVGSKAVDMVDNVLVAGTGISLSKSSAAGTVTINSTASGGTDGDANWDDASVNLQYVNTDMISTVITSTYANKRHFVIGATATSTATGDTEILLPAASSTYQYHEIWVGALNESATKFVRVSSGGFNRVLSSGELVCFKCLRLNFTWTWIAT